MDALLRRRIIMMEGQSPTPPPVGPIPFIRNADLNAYIDTGIEPDENTRLIIWARNFNPQALVLAGAQESTSGPGLMISTYTRENTGGLRLDFNTKVITAQDQYQRLTGYHKYEIGEGKLKVDDVVVSTTSANAFNVNLSIHLFGQNRGGTHVNMWLPADICACQIIKNGTILRDFTAVNTPSVGMFDRISNTLFTNAGTGAFSFGTFMPDAYTRLEYVEATGAQWFDSGIYGKEGLISCIRFIITDDTDPIPVLYGTMTSGQASSYYLLQFGSTNVPLSKFNFYANSSSPSSVFTSNTANRLFNEELLFTKERDGRCNLRTMSTGLGYKTVTISDSWVSTDTIGVCGLKIAGQFTNPHGFRGKIYYMNFGGERSFVPAKVGAAVGMYDTYNDVFYPSITETPFLEPSN